VQEWWTRKPRLCTCLYHVNKTIDDKISRPKFVCRFTSCLNAFEEEECNIIYHKIMTVNVVLPKKVNIPGDISQPRTRQARYK